MLFGVSCEAVGAVLVSALLCSVVELVSWRSEAGLSCCALVSLLAVFESWAVSEARGASVLEWVAVPESCVSGWVVVLESCELGWVVVLESCELGCVAVSESCEFGCVAAAESCELELVAVSESCELGCVAAALS
ncbi:hypothetical protein [Nocardia sp. GAS34]|uniref:hypothetical protein n=1 Tax=unclassified Nocardia TaxID=2637762 RepID=UPI003D25994F